MTLRSVCSKNSRDSLLSVLGAFKTLMFMGDLEQQMSRARTERTVQIKVCEYQFCVPVHVTGRHGFVASALTKRKSIKDIRNRFAIGGSSLTGPSVLFSVHYVFLFLDLDQ